MKKVVAVQNTVRRFITILQGGTLSYSVFFGVILSVQIIIGYNFGQNQLIHSILEALLPVTLFGGILTSFIAKYSLVKILKRTEMLNNRLLLTKNSIDELGTSELKIIEISKLMKKLRLFQLFSFGAFISKSKYNIRRINPLFKNFFKQECIFILNILTDLRSDLQIRLAEQQQTLEQAKSEVEKNIGGTTELESISELQQARLDRQIEQFEELQRVLVKG